MSSNSESIMQQLQHDVKELIDLVSGPEAFRHSAYSIESRLFRGLLVLGKALLQLFFITRAAQALSAPMLETSGKTLRYHDKRPWRAKDYYSVPVSQGTLFGKLTFTRPYYYLKGEAGVCPLDAELRLPKRCYSDLLREWASCSAACSAAEGSFRDSTALLQRILSLPLSLAAVETMSAEDAVDVAAFYDKASPSTPVLPTPLPATLPAAKEAACLLVVQADGKGVPMVQPAATSSPPRLGKGQKRGTKKEAIVTALYTIAPYVRTPQEVLAALLREHPAIFAASPTRRPRRRRAVLPPATRRGL